MVPEFLIIIITITIIIIIVIIIVTIIVWGLMYLYCFLMRVHDFSEKGHLKTEGGALGGYAGPDVWGGCALE